MYKIPKINLSGNLHRSFFKYELGGIICEFRPCDTLTWREYEQPAFVPLIGFRRITQRSIFITDGFGELLGKFRVWFFGGLRGAFHDDGSLSAFEIECDVWIFHDVAGMTRL